MSSGWRNDPATYRQRSFAAELGLDLPEGCTKGEASDLIDDALGAARPREVAVFKLELPSATDLMDSSFDHSRTQPGPQREPWVDSSVFQGHRPDVPRLWARVDRTESAEQRRQRYRQSLIIAVALAVFFLVVIVL